MTEVHKRKILQILRNRGLHARADWVDRQLPERVDLDKNAGLLATLQISPADLADPRHDRAQARHRATPSTAQPTDARRHLAGVNAPTVDHTLGADPRRGAELTGLEITAVTPEDLPLDDHEGLVVPG